MSLGPRSGFGGTGLGAVGGARGTAAGALRVLIEFITQYDSAAVKQLEGDLNSLNAQEQGFNQQRLAAEKAIDTAERKRLQTRKEIAKLVSTIGGRGGAPSASSIRRELREIQAAGALTKEGQARLSVLGKLIGHEKQLVGLVTKEAQLARGIPGLKAIAVRHESELVDKTKERVAAEEQLNRFQRLRAELPKRLAGLAVGAIGGIFGGALIGVGFALAEKALDAVEQNLLDIFDPARHARESILEVGQAINQLAAEEENAGDRGKATIAFLKELGLTADAATIKALEQAGALAAQREALDAYKQILDITTHSEQLHKEALDAWIAAITEARLGTSAAKFDIDDMGASAEITAEAERRMADAADAVANAADAAAAASRRLDAEQRQLAATAQLAAFAEENLATAISNIAGLKSAGFDARIEGLQAAGDSSRTQRLQKKIDDLQSQGSGGGGASRSRELANIAEERALILLRMRLRLLGTNINLEKFSGKFLLEAINAKLKALQKEADAQDRLNRLLALQFKMAQTIRRQEGESINEFLERRAQENRELLSEQRDLEREAVVARLEELKEKTQDEVALQELAEKAKTTAVRSGTNDRLRELQKQLAASKKADADALKAKIEAVKRAKEAYEKDAQNAIFWSQKANTEKVRIAVAAAKTIEDLAKISGQVSGLQAARSFLESLLAAGVLPPDVVAEVKAALARITNTLHHVSEKAESIYRNANKNARHFQHGGFIPLTNASTPFGANIRFGDGGGGSEALVLQHQVAKQLRQSKAAEQIGPFYVNGSDNRLRDRYELKRAVKAGVEEALR